MTDLGQRDIRIFENEQEREIARLIRGSEIPLTLGLALDVSRSVRGQLFGFEGEQAAWLFRDVLRKGDAGFVLSFNYEIRFEVDVSEDPKQLGEAARRVA